MINITSALENLNKYHSYVTELVPDIYYFTDDFRSVIGNNSGDVLAFAEQPDGKILVGLDSVDTSLYRFNSDGSIDGTFNLNISNGFVSGIEVDNSGNIYISGSFNESSTTYSLLGLNSDGTVNSSFSVGTGFDNSIRKIKLSSDGSYLYCGGDFNNYNGSPATYLAKLSTTDGSLDATFESNVNSSLTATVLDFDINSDGNIFAAVELSIKKFSSSGVLDGSFTSSTINGNFEKIKVISNGKIIIAGSFDQITEGVTTYNVRSFSRLNSDGSYDSSFTPYISRNYNGDNGSVYGFDIDSSGNIYFGGDFVGIVENSNKYVTHFFAKLDSNGNYVEFNNGYDFEERVHSVFVLSNNKVLVGGSFNKPTYRITIYNTNGEFDINFKIPNSIEWFGISDGGDDLEDGGNFLNTNLTQLYNDIKEDNVNDTDSIPNSHTPADNDYSYDIVDFFGYAYKPTNLDGIVRDGSSYFGAGSEYFTSMYAGMFCLVADNINIEEFSVTGDSGTDGGGFVQANSFEITVKGQNYACFLKSIYGDDPSMNQIIITNGSLDGLTQLYDTTSEYDDHCIQGLSGREFIAYVLVTRGKDEGYGGDGDPLSLTDAKLVASKFIQSLTGLENIYRFEFNPPNKATEDSDGNLDTSIVNGHSIQRGGYIETVNFEAKRKVSVNIDGEEINDRPQTVGDILGIVQL